MNLGEPRFGVFSRVVVALDFLSQHVVETREADAMVQVHVNREQWCLHVPGRIVVPATPGALGNPIRHYEQLKKIHLPVESGVNDTVAERADSSSNLT